MNFRPLLIAAAAAALAAGPAAASAPPTEFVSYHDLNLAGPDGQAQLQDRLDKAARRVCRFDDSGQIRTADEENACYRASRQQAAVQMAQAVSEERRGG